MRLESGAIESPDDKESLGKQTLATLGRKDGMDRSGSKLDVKLELRLQTLET